MSEVISFWSKDQANEIRKNHPDAQRVIVEKRIRYRDYTTEEKMAITAYEGDGLLIASSELFEDECDEHNKVYDTIYRVHFVSNQII